MIPISLTISGFLSYRDPVTVNFDHFDLACISGPNGAGKSSLLDAITWALFGEARKRDDSVINSQCTAASVRFEFAYERNIYRVERSKQRDKSAVLEFQICHSQDGSEPVWRPLTERSVAETKQRIADTLRMDYDTFVNASFFLQGEADQFTRKVPGDRKRVLSKILGLDIWEQYKTRAGERRRAVEIEVSELDGSLKEIGAELAEEPERRRRLKDIDESLRQQTALRKSQEKILENAQREANSILEQQHWLENQQRMVNSLERRLSELNNRLGDRRRESAEYADVLDRELTIEAAYAEWQSARKMLEQMEKTADQYRELDRQREAVFSLIRAARARLEQELETLSGSAARIEIGRKDAVSLSQQIQTEEDHIRQAQEKLEGRSEIENNIKAEREQSSALQAENKHLEILGKDLTSRVDKLREAEGAECPLCGQPLLPNDRLALVERLESDREELRRSFAGNAAAFLTCERTIHKLEADIAGMKAVESELLKSRVQLASLASRLDALEQARSEWEAVGEQRLIEVSFALENENYEPESRRRLAELDADLDAIAYDPTAHSTVRAAEEAGRASEADLRMLEVARSAIEKLKRDIADIAGEIAGVENDLASERKTYAEAESALELRRASAADPEEAERLLFEYREGENILHRDLGSARQQVEILDARKQQKLALETERGERAAMIGRYRQLERAFGKDGVPALLIEQALPEIEARANDILTRLSDGGMMVRFVTQARYKDKQREDLKETLGIEISDGVGVREYELFSGGEAFRVNFAIRLALSQILAQRAGAQLKTLVIDEGFGSQDLVGRQRLIETINLVRKDFAKILVITHIDELKDAFPNRVEVEKTERGSTVRVM